MRHPGWWLGAGIFLAGLVLAVFVFRVFDDSPKHSTNHPPYPSQYNLQTFPDETPQEPALRHLQPGETVQYNSNPPTNGKHSGGAAPWGVSSVPVAPELLVHNMEHGAVIVWYNCEGGPAPLDAAACSELRDQLAGIVEPRATDGMYIVMVPYSDMENRIALTAWQNLDAFDEFDRLRIESFIASFECRFNIEGLC